MVSIDQRRSQWTRGVHRRQDRRANRSHGEPTSWRDRPHASAADRVRRSRSTAARARRSSRRHGQPDTPRATAVTIGQRPDRSAQENRCRGRTAAERVPRRHRRRHGQPRHSVRRGAHDRRGRRAIQRDRSIGRRRTSSLATRRVADALLRGGP